MDNKELKKLIEDNNIQLTNSKFVSHMTLENAGYRIDSFTIVWPGNAIDGTTVLRQVYTPRTKNKGWGKGEVLFFIDQPKSPEFRTLEEFILHYKNK